MPAEYTTGNGPEGYGDGGTSFVALGSKQKRTPTTEASSASEAVNLVDVFTADEAKTIGAKAWDLYVKDVRSRAPRMKKLREYIELYASLIKAKNFPFNKSANINLPLLTYPNLQVQARLYDMVWPENGKVIYAAPSSAEDVSRAEATEKFANSYIRNEMPEMEQGLDDSLAQMCLFGSSIRRTYWDPYEKRVRSDWIPLEDFVVAYDHRSQDPSLRGVPRYTLVHHMTLADLESYGDAGVFENVDGLEQENEASAEGQEIRDTKAKLDGVDITNDSDDPDRPRMVLEQHCRWRLPDRPNKHPAFDGKIHHVIITVDEPTKRVLRIVLREEDEPKEAQRFGKEQAQWQAFLAAQQAMAMPVMPGGPMPMPLPPPLGVDKTGKPIEPVPPRKREVCFFTHYRAFPSEGFYGLGFGDFLAPLNRAANTLINQHIDGVTLRNAKPGFISRQLKMQRGTTNVQPGELVEVDGPIAALREGIMFVDPPMNDPTTMPLVKLILDLGDKLAGSADLMSGSTSGANRTAKEIQILNSQLMKQITILARRVKGAFRHELDKMWRCWGVFLPEEPEPTQVVDPATGQPETLAISRKMFLPDARVTPAADPRMRFEKHEEAMQKFQFVMQNPVTGQNPQAMYEGVAEVLQSLGADRILSVVQKPQPPQPPQPKQPFEEEAGWLQNQNSPVLPGDNDEQHVQTHMAFLASPHAQVMDKNQRQMAEQHIRDHHASFIQKQGHAAQQQQQMMSGPAGPPTGGPPGGPPMGGPPMGPMGPPPGPPGPPMPNGGPPA